jgi:hypothetical protein
MSYESCLDLLKEEYPEILSYTGIYRLLTSLLTYRVLTYLLTVLTVPSPQCTLVVKFRSSGLYSRQIFLQLLTRGNGTPCNLPMLPIGGTFGRLTKIIRQKIGQTKVRFRFCFLSRGFYGDSLEDSNKISTVHVGRFLVKPAGKSCW